MASLPQRAALVIAGFVLAPGRAHAGNNTYCVGAPGACGGAQVRTLHPRWHEHAKVTEGSGCYECWDEVDNTCATDFLDSHREWRLTSPAECASRLRAVPASEGVRFHAIRGQDVATPPPPPRTVQLRAEVAAVRPGPYAAGESVEFETRVVDDAGASRPYAGGEVVVVDGQGREVARAPVAIGPDGIGRAQVLLSATGDLRARFDVRDPRLGQNETLGASRTQALALAVGECRYRALVEGTPGEVYIERATVTVTGTVRTHRADAVRPHEIASVPLVFTIRVEGHPLQRVAATPSGDRFVARVRLPALASDTANASTSLSGGTGVDAVCADEPRPFVVSRLGVALVPRAPERCYVTRPCRVEFAVRLPSGGDAERRARAFVADPALVTTATLDDSPVQREGTAASGSIAIEHTPARAGLAAYRLALDAQGRRVEREVRVDVRDAIVLRLPAMIDFGTVRGGTHWSRTCRPIDFSKGSGAFESDFSLEVRTPGRAPCEARFVAPGEGGTRVALEGFSVGGAPVLTIGRKLEAQICLEVGSCPGAERRNDRTLLVRSRASEFSRERANVRLSYRIEHRGFVDCYHRHLILVGFCLLVALVAHGFIRPRQFGVDDAIKIAREPKALTRAPARRLRDLPGGRRRWNRSARVHFAGSGDAVASARAAVLTFAPGVGCVLLRTRSRVGREDRRTHKMVDEPVPAGGIEMRRGVTYEVGSLVVVLR